LRQYGPQRLTQILYQGRPLANQDHEFCDG
jgi:hypothetical protein